LDNLKLLQLKFLVRATLLLNHKPTAAREIGLKIQAPMEVIGNGNSELTITKVDIGNGKGKETKDGSPIKVKTEVIGKSLSKTNQALEAIGNNTLLTPKETGPGQK
jgi:hypothetical protein